MANPRSVPDSPEEYYADLVTRNRHFVGPETQERLRTLKILVAGCGSAGGACIEPLARLGVERFRLADNGEFELNNLNRQHAFGDAIGVNKAEFHLREVLRINPHADVQAFPGGITALNMASLVEWADLVIDAVDVTAADAIRMKIQLHECAHARRKPVVCMLDLGFAQWGRTFDYREPHLRPLDGRTDAARNARHPLKALFRMFPVSAIPAHCLPMVIDLLENPGASASQLGCSADLLSAIAAASVTRFASTGEVVPGWAISLESLAVPWRQRFRAKVRSLWLVPKLRRLLARLP